MKRNLFVDIETTGLKPEEGHVPLEIGMKVEEPGNDASSRSIIVLICPTEEQWAKASQQALVVNGITWERLQKEGMSLEDAISEICAWLIENDINMDTVQYIGQNPQFDLKFLRKYMGSELDFMGFPFEEPINVIDMAKELARKDPNMRFISFSGTNIALSLGIQAEDKVHTALGGVDAVRRNYYALAERLSNTPKLEKRRIY